MDGQVGGDQEDSEAEEEEFERGEGIGDLVF